MRRHRHDRNAAGDRSHLPHGARDLIPIDVRHLTVEQDQVVRAVVHRPDRLHPASDDVGLVSENLQLSDSDLLIDDVVFHHEDLFLLFNSWSGGLQAAVRRAKARRYTMHHPRQRARQLRAAHRLHHERIDTLGLEEIDVRAPPPDRRDQHDRCLADERIGADHSGNGDSVCSVELHLQRDRVRTFAQSLDRPLRGRGLLDFD